MGLCRKMPDSDSIKVMAAIDALSVPMRALVREYGHNVVLGMIADGHKDPDKLREELEAWRAKRQQEIAVTNWLAKAPPIAPDARPPFSVVGPPLTSKRCDELLFNELFPDA
jgi:hypothetical protein